MDYPITGTSEKKLPVFAASSEPAAITVNLPPLQPPKNVSPLYRVLFYSRHRTQSAKKRNASCSVPHALRCQQRPTRPKNKQTKKTSWRMCGRVTGGIWQSLLSVFHSRQKQRHVGPAVQKMAREIIARKKNKNKKRKKKKAHRKEGAREERGAGQDQVKG